MTIKKTLGMAVLATGLFGSGMTAQHVLSKVTQEPVSLTAQQEPVVIKTGYLEGQRTPKETVVTKDDKKGDTIKDETLEDINLGVSAKPKGVRKELVRQELGQKQTTRQVILDEVDEWVQQETQSAKRTAKTQYNQQLGQETMFVREPLKTIVNNSDFINYDESTNNQESEYNSINDETSLVLDESDSNRINDETALVLDELTEANAFGNQFVNNTDYPTGTEIVNTSNNNDTLDTIEPEINESEVIESEVIESEVIESEVIESEINESEVIESEINESEVIESEVIESEINESEVIESEINESEIVESEINESEVIESEVIESEVIESEINESEVIEPEYEEPEYEEPEYEEPEYEEPEYEEPVYEEPEYEEPEYEEPEYEEPVNSGRPVYPGDLFATAESMIGIPYVWGGRTPEQGFDCSGFVQYVFMETYGMQVGWWTGEQQYAGQLISVEEAQPGDLYFWGTYGGDTTHVAIATGGGSYIHAPQPGSSVGYGSIEWFTPQFAIRVL